MRLRHEGNAGRHASGVQRVSLSKGLAKWGVMASWPKWYDLRALVDLELQHAV